MNKRKLWNVVRGYLYISPVLLGILLFTLIPMVSSLYYSFFNYYSNMPSVGEFIGFGNYIKAFTVDWKNFSNSVLLTIGYTVFSVPFNLVLSYALALLLSKNFKGVKIFRTVFYLPVMIPTVVSGMLWKDLTDTNYGLLNHILHLLGDENGYTFFNSPDTVMPSLIFLSLFTIGGNMVLWVAQIKSVPVQLYEAADLEGAGAFTKLFSVTLPLCTPMIFYNLIMGIIGALQTFAQPFIMRSFANSHSLAFYVIYIYDTLINGLNTAYASALSWLLFLIIGAITILVFKTSKWVYYGEDA